MIHVIMTSQESILSTSLSFLSFSSLASCETKAANSELTCRTFPLPSPSRTLLTYGVCGSSFPRGFCVGIYATNSTDACQYVITHAKVNILIVENDMQLQKILAVNPPPSAT